MQFILWCKGISIFVFLLVSLSHSNSFGYIHRKHEDRVLLVGLQGYFSFVESH